MHKALQINRIDIEPLSGRIGAIVNNVDLRDGVDPATASEILAALDRYKVVFFRNQHLTNHQHEAFAAAIGQPFVHPLVPLAEGSR